VIRFAREAVLLLLLLEHAVVASVILETTPPNDPFFSSIASLTNYGLYQSNPFFSTTDRAWLETSAKLGGKFRHNAFAFEAVGLALRTTGREPYGSGHTPQFDLDTLYAQWNQTAGLPFKLTIGRQPIALGTQFLVGDGVYDGFDPDYGQAVYHNPRRSFDAARLEFDAGKFHFDTFVYSVHPTWDGGGERNGVFGGMEVSRAFESIGGNYGAGLFWRESRSQLDNDMAIFTLRGEQHLPSASEFYASGELNWEFAGTGRNASYITTPGQRMNEVAWHAELGWQADKRPLKPFVEAGYVYYSPDFTPVATGFSDWGKWYLGNQIDWIIFGTDTQIIRAQAGFWPHEKVKLRAQFHNTRLASGPAGTLSNEVSVIAEYNPNARIWMNLLVGYSIPGETLRRSSLANPFSFINSGASPVGNRSSVDVVLAVGFTL
jgi:hypothetical protein